MGLALALLNPVEHALASDGSEPRGRTDFDSVMKDDAAVVSATLGTGTGDHTPQGANARSSTLQSFTPVCEYRPTRLKTASHDDSWGVAHACLDSATYCPSSTEAHPLTAAWVLTAPASPAPGPDDWVNTWRTTCLSERQARPEVVVTQEQFRRLPIPAPEIIVQPPDRVTLINIGTNFLTREQTVVLPATVLGQPVRVRATPARYTWRYGDGGSLTTADPGNYYPNMRTAHTYSVPGTYRVELSTTFTGEFSVGGGPWQPIDGTATTRSPSMSISAEERRAVLTR